MRSCMSSRVKYKMFRDVPPGSGQSKRGARRDWTNRASVEKVRAQVFVKVPGCGGQSEEPRTFSEGD